MHFRIKGYTFQLASPYSEGHRLTAGEAQALNDLRTENIQNNFRPHVNSQVEKLGPGELLAQSVLDALQAKLATYDSSYKFNEKATRNRIGDIEAEAKIVAREKLAAESQSSEAQFSDDQIEALLAEWANLPAVIEEARIRVQARRSALTGGMESL